MWGRTILLTPLSPLFHPDKLFGAALHAPALAGQRQHRASPPAAKLRGRGDELGKHHSAGSTPPPDALLCPASAASMGSAELLLPQQRLPARGILVPPS